MVTGWGSKKYSGDLFPSYLPEDQVIQLRKRYRHIPEEFYTRTGLDVVTPDNVEAFLEKHKSLGIRWILQEQFSGSGRTSAEAALKGISTLFQSTSGTAGTCETQSTNARQSEFEKNYGLWSSCLHQIVVCGPAPPMPTTRTSFRRVAGRRWTCSSGFYGTTRPR